MPTFDAQAATGFVLSQTTHVEREVNEVQYPDIQYPGLIPVDLSAHPMAQTVTYYSSDEYGKADWINGNSDDIPLAGSERSKHETAVYTAGIGYGWGWEEVERAMMLGINLSNEDAMAARRAYEEMVDRVAVSGDATKGFEGLINNSSVAATGATTGTWSSATAVQILKDINDALQIVHSATATTAMADTLLLPWVEFNRIASMTFGPEGISNVLQMVQKNNIYTATTGLPLTIRGFRQLDTAGVGDTTRMIAYRRSPQVLKLHIPMPHRFLSVWQRGPLSWEVPGVFRLGGLDIRRPKEVAYVDGI